MFVAVELILLLWCVHTNMRTNMRRGQQQGKERLSIVSYSLLDLLQPRLPCTGGQISPAFTFLVVSLLPLCWSEAEDVVLQWAETVGSVSVGAVPVGLS